MKKSKSQKVESLTPAGYSELLRRYSLSVIPHHCESYIANKGMRKTTTDMQKKTTEIYPKKYAPKESLGDQLTFALKFEGVNLEILSALFQKIDEQELTSFIKKTPMGRYTRKTWFLYEFLTGRLLDLEPTKVSNYIDLLDEKKYYTAISIPSKRQKINNNLLGNKSFCPIVRKTENLKAFEDANLDKQSLKIIKDYPEELLQRAHLYLYTKETKSSFEIERETPDQRRANRFVTLLTMADKREFFNKESLIELQQATVDERFANHDFRGDQNYVGQTVNIGFERIHFVSPKPEDLGELMEGMFKNYQRMMSSELHPVITASVTAFGFVFMHPFDDGNGRIHRFLIHNILAKTGFTPEGMIFPVSATMLKKIKEYDRVLELFSTHLLPLVDYELQNDGKMFVKNETSLHYRYIDMSIISECLFGFIQETMETELVSELDFLRNYDTAKRSLSNVVDMPDRLIDLFIRICIENHGRLSKIKRKKLFEKLEDEEILAMENCIQESFGILSA